MSKLLCCVNSLLGVNYSDSLAQNLWSEHSLGGGGGGPDVQGTSGIRSQVFKLGICGAHN